MCMKVFWLHLTFRLILSKREYVHTYTCQRVTMAQLTAVLGRLGGAILELFPLTEQVRYEAILR